MGFARLFAAALLITVASAVYRRAIRKASMSVSSGGLAVSKSGRSNGRHVVRRTMPKVPKEEKQPKQKWIYAIQTCAAKSYVHQVETQLSTWLKPVNKSQVLIVGGPYNNGEFPCDDSKIGNKALNCKEATVLYRAAELAEDTDADWLFHVIDDAYVILPRIWKMMEGLDPSEPRVFANIGCGGFWKSSPVNRGGNMPMPKAWVQPKPSCEQVERKGGICTGAGYIVSRGALKLLRQNHTLPAFIEHYKQMSVGRASDSTSSCLFYDRNITINGLPWGAKMWQTVWMNDPKVIARDKKYGTPEMIVRDKKYGMVHVTFGNDKAYNAVFMEKLQNVVDHHDFSS